MKPLRSALNLTSALVMIPAPCIHSSGKRSKKTQNQLERDNNFQNQNFKLKETLSMYKHILVATDGSALSKTATNKAIELASQLGSQLTIVNVIPRIMNSLFDGSFSIPAKQKIELMGKITDAAQLIVDKVQKDAEKAGVYAKTLVVKSNIVSDAIISTATKKNVDLIVMASHGRNGLNRLILGSETLQVLTHSNIAVLVLR